MCVCHVLTPLPRKRNFQVIIQAAVATVPADIETHSFTYKEEKDEGRKAVNGVKEDGRAKKLFLLN